MTDRNGIRIFEPQCLICDAILHVYTKGVVEGVTFRGSPQYGTRFDGSLLCEHRMEVYICDGCVFQKKDRIELLYIENPKSEIERTHFTAWDPSRKLQPKPDED